MEVKNVVVHFLQKIGREQIADLDLSSELLVIDDQVQVLIDLLDKSYKRSDVTSARFKSAGERYFPIKFRNYIYKENNYSFLEFSIDTAKNLRDIIESNSPAKGGFLVFCEYSTNGQEIVAVFFIRDTNSPIFRKKTGDSFYSLDKVEHLDIDKLAMACKIYSNQYKSDETEGYLSFLKRKMEDFSGYFLNWIAAENFVSNKTITQNFMELIDLCERPKDERGETISKSDFLQQVIDYSKALPSLLSIADVSQKFFNDDTYLMNLAENNQIQIDSEFQPNDSILKSYINIDVSSGGIRLNFPRRVWESRQIRVLEEDGKKLVVIESASLYDEVLNKTN